MIDVQDNPASSRFEINIDGQVAFLNYERTATELAILHTEVPLALRHRGLGSRLAKAAIDTARTDGLRLKVLCPFVKAYRRTHPEE